MHRVLTVLAIALACGAALVAPSARAAEATVSDTLNSAYVWRGQVYNDEAVWQPALNVTGAGGWIVGAWANWNLTDRRGDDTDNEFDEVDLQIAYGKTSKGFIWEIGMWEYLYPHQVVEEESEVEGEEPTVRAADGTREAYLSLGYDTILTPTLLVSYDFDEVEGWYGSLAVSHDFQLQEEKLSAGVALSIGAADAEYNEFYFGVDDAKLNDFNASVNVVYSFASGWSVTAYGQYTKLVDEDIEEAATADDSGYFNDSDIFVGGLTMDYTF